MHLIKLTLCSISSDLLLEIVFFHSYTTIIINVEVYCSTSFPAKVTHFYDKNGTSDGNTEGEEIHIDYRGSIHQVGGSISIKN